MARVLGRSAPGEPPSGGGQTAGPVAALPDGERLGARPPELATTRAQALEALPVLEGESFVNMFSDELQRRAESMAMLARAPLWGELQPEERRRFGRVAARMAEALRIQLPVERQQEIRRRAVRFARPLSESTREEIEQRIRFSERLGDEELHALDYEQLMGTGRELTERRDSPRWAALASADQQRVQRVVGRLDRALRWRQEHPLELVPHPPDRPPSIGGPIPGSRPYISPSQEMAMARELSELGPFASLTFAIAVLSGQELPEALARAHELDVADGMMMAAGDVAAEQGRISDVTASALRPASTFEPVSAPAATPATASGEPDAMEATAAQAPTRDGEIANSTGTSAAEAVAGELPSTSAPAGGQPPRAAAQATPPVAVTPAPADAAAAGGGPLRFDPSFMRDREIPAGTVVEAANTVDARSWYRDWVLRGRESARAREVEILRDRRTGRIFVVQGETARTADTAEVARSTGARAEDLESLRHFHPPDAPGAVPIGQLPSSTDVTSFIAQARASRQVMRTSIDYRLPDGTWGRTDILVDPTVGPLQVHVWVRRGPQRGFRTLTEGGPLFQVTINRISRGGFSAVPADATMAPRPPRGSGETRASGPAAVVPGAPPPGRRESPRFRGSRGLEPPMQSDPQAVETARQWVDRRVESVGADIQAAVRAGDVQRAGTLAERAGIEATSIEEGRARPLYRELIGLAQSDRDALRDRLNEGVRQAIRASSPRVQVVPGPRGQIRGVTGPPGFVARPPVPLRWRTYGGFEPDR
jgi:hypothetical protein